MATAPSTGSLTFYPAYTFSASPTYFAWVKLTAHDIHHTLRSRPGFTATSKSELLFYLNHPIQFVQIVGVIVVHEDYHEKFWSFTVDDGSGEVVECVCWKSDKQQGKNRNGKLEKPDIEQQKAEQEQLRREEIIKSLDIGTVVQVKGTINTFREVRQLNIERLSVVPSTTHEVVLMAARTKFLVEVLMKPWVVSADRQKRLFKQAQGQKQEESQRIVRLKERAKKLEEREKRHAERLAKEYEAEEDRRREGADEAKHAGMDLQRSPSHDVVTDDFADLAY